MAQAFAKKWAPDGVKVFSAGSRPAGSVHPIVIETMLEKGIDISREIPKGFNTLLEGQFDLVVGMGCGDACPVTRAKRVVSWDIPNPKDQPIKEVRLIRDKIEFLVQSLLEEIRS